MMSFELLSHRLRLASPFAIAHDTYRYRDTIILRLSDGAVSGFGEIPIVPYYAMTRKWALSKADRLSRSLLAVVRPRSCRSVDDVVRAAAEIEARAEVHPFVRAGLSEALVDLAARMEGVSVADILHVAPVRERVSSYTIAERDRERARELVARSEADKRGFPLKVKCGYAGDEEAVAAVRDAAPASPIWVDCNGGWSRVDGPARGRAMVAAGASLIEEPVSHDVRTLSEVAQAARGVPVIADESVASLEELCTVMSGAPAVAGAVLKIAKLGGPLTFLAARRTIAEAGLRFMVGEMVESGIGTAWALALSDGATWVDLDAPALLAEDVARGLTVRPGGVAVHGEVGIGVDIGVDDE